MLLFQKRTRFNDITVTRQGDRVTLWSPRTIRQTVISLDVPGVPVLEYARNTMLALALCPDPSSALVLGLGGGSIPMMLQHACDRVHVTVVEIDPDMQEVAQEHFRFRTSSRIEVVIGDACTFLQDRPGRYDIVILDAYLGDKFPDGARQEDFFCRIWEAIRPAGVLVANLLTGKQTEFADLVKRLRDVFCDVQLLFGKESANALAFATAQPFDHAAILREARRREEELACGVPLSELAKRLVTFSSHTHPLGRRRS